jgi:hypothetical protein
MSSHENRLAEARQLADPTGTPDATVEFVLSHGVPLSSLDWFRRKMPGGSCLPDPGAFREILRLLKDEVERALLAECEASQYAAFAMHG